MNAWLRRLVIGFVLIPLLTSAQEKVTISGSIRDASSYENLAGASINVMPNQAIQNAERLRNSKSDSSINKTDNRELLIPHSEDKLGAKSNNYGFYSLTLNPGDYNLMVSFAGYLDTVIRILIQDNYQLTIDLNPQNTLKEVDVYSQSYNSQLKNTIMGVSVLSTKEVEKVPVIFGERDLLKTIQLLPGVSSAGEGSSGFFVRGGSSDQNLIILDEASVYNASHLFGFFSTFNSDAIKEATLYKGGMPAQYGGRLSSVLDISMLDGNKKKFQAKGGVGLIASRLSLEGPLIREKGSFMVSGRRTYADLFLKLSKDSAVNNSSLYFYDLNLKANYQLGKNNTLYLSGYFGKDFLGYSDEFKFDWGNTTSTLRWNHIYNPRLFSNLSLIYGDFDYSISVFDKKSEFSIRSKIKNYTIKKDFQFFKNVDNTIRFGVQVLRQKIVPASLKATEESQINNVSIESRHGIDLSIYAAHEWRISEKIALEYGLRVNHFSSLGPGEFSTYNEDGSVASTQTVTGNKLVQGYLNIEPRLSASLMLSEESSLKLSFNRNAQNLHQLTNSTASLPTDVWIMSSPNVRPQTALQGALGYYQDFGGGDYEFSTEVYYKDMQHQIDLKNGAEIQANSNVEADLLYGVGRAYGLEFFVKKRRGRFNGWLSYTLSKSERQFEGINLGKWYPAKQDRRHDLNLVGMFDLNTRISLSANFVVSSGNAVTFPSGKYWVDDAPIWYYSERNGYRMPAYHRFDLGLTVNSKEDRKFKSSWNFGLYNVYNQKNAYLINFRQKKDQPNQTEAYQISLFGIVPSITWNFNF